MKVYQIAAIGFFLSLELVVKPLPKNHLSSMVAVLKEL